MTATEMTLEDRVAALEKELAELRTAIQTKPNSSILTMTGKITDLEAFDEMVRLGREFRKTGKLPDTIEEVP